MRPRILALIGFLVAGLIIGFLAAYLGLSDADDPVKPTPESPKTVTVQKTVPGPERTVERTVPGPERTVRKPGTTTWIIVCGEKTQRVEGNKPFHECNLPDTGGPKP